MQSSPFPPSVDPDVTPADVGPARRTHWWADRLDILAVVAAGGAAGSLARWGVGQAVPHSEGSFALSTFLVNVVGCLLIGVLMVLVLEVWPPTRLVRPFLGVGLLGGFTTFSTSMLDTTEMVRAGHQGTAAAYLFGTLAAAVLAVWASATTTRAVLERRRERAVRRSTEQEGASS